MNAVSAVTAYLLYQNGTIKPITVEIVIALDREWAPYAQVKLTGSVTENVPINPASELAPRLIIECEVRYRHGDTLAAITTDVASGTLATLTSTHTGDTLSDISDHYSTPYNSTTAPADQYRAFNLCIREWTYTASTRAVAISATSDESMAQDYACIGIGPTYWGYPDGSNMQEENLMRRALGPLGLVYGGTVSPIDPIWLTQDQCFQEVGETTWDFLVRTIGASGARVWCDENRLWWIERSEKTPNPTSWELKVLDVERTRTRDNDDYYTGLAVRFTWTDSDGATQERYLAAAVGQNPQKTQVLDWNGRPDQRLVEGMLAASQRREGWASDIYECMNDVRITPGDLVYSDETTAHLCKAVEWSFPDGTMRVRA